MDSSLTQTLMFIAALVISISVHEFAHAITADLSGDPTPRLQGRITLNPIKHFDQFGAIMILIMSFSGYGIGWGKPVQTNPSKMKNPRWDSLFVAIAGPISNILMAAVAGSVLKVIIRTGTIAYSSEGAMLLPTPILFLFVFVLVNISLAVFNMLPLGPLDGHWVVGAFLPIEARLKWFRWNQTTGSLVLLGLIIMGQLGGGPGIIGTIMGPIRDFFFKILVGI
ncbi:MAG: site-2 protease family protein [Armatimonadetes bacterium]|nr:site-2 protease family protein [Armatimonadota bacterium]